MVGWLAGWVGGWLVSWLVSERASEMGWGEGMGTRVVESFLSARDNETALHVTVVWVRASLERLLSSTYDEIFRSFCLLFFSFSAFSFSSKNLQKMFSS